MIPLAQHVPCLMSNRRSKFGVNHFSLYVMIFSEHDLNSQSGLCRLFRQATKGNSLAHISVSAIGHPALLISGPQPPIGPRLPKYPGLMSDCPNIWPPIGPRLLKYPGLMSDCQNDWPPIGLRLPKYPGLMSDCTNIWPPIGPDCSSIQG